MEEKDLGEEGRKIGSWSVSAMRREKIWTHSSRDQQNFLVPFPADLLCDPVSSVGSVDDDLDLLQPVVLLMKLCDETVGRLRSGQEGDGGVFFGGLRKCADCEGMGSKFSERGNSN